MAPQEQGQLRNDAEALVKASVWLGRRAELILANIRDGRLHTVSTDALAGMIEAEDIRKGLTELARKAGAPLPETMEIGQ